VWLELHNPLQLRLNVATKKVIDKIRSDKAITNGSYRQNSNNNLNSNNNGGKLNTNNNGKELNGNGNN